MSAKEKIIGKIEGKRDLFINVSDSIWEYAETRFEEFKSSELLCKVLEEEGFTIAKGIADMETAFVASFGTGKPVIGFLGEYDALYGLSQEAGIAEKKPKIEGGKGHGCGHHALGTGALAAAIAVKEYIKENNIQGTVRYYGCPAEESGSGKAYIARAGYFKDVDVALTWHPFAENYVWSTNFLATIRAYFKFHGISSHAGASPHLGRSALDAVELMNVGVNYLREHVVQDARIHYAITNSGGLSPNVVQAEAEVLYQIRAPKLSQVREIYDRVVDVARGAALMTGTKLEVVFYSGCSNMICNRTLEALLYEKFKEVGPVPVDEKDIQFAREIRKTLNEKEKASTEDTLNRLYVEKGKEIAKLISDKEVIDILYPYIPADTILSGSTDVGDVSWNVPTAQISTASYAKDTPGHSWQLVAQGKEELFHKAMLQAGKVLALSAIELFEKTELIAQIRKEFEERLGGETYVCPIPMEVKPSSIR